MNDGVDMTSGKRFFEGSGYFKDMTSYDELFKAIEKGMASFDTYVSDC